MEGSEMIEDNSEISVEEEDWVVALPMNKSFGRRLALLQHSAMFSQYQLAYFNTIGGAHHLCNNPRQAFVIAKQQEILGRSLSSQTLILRAKGYQAVNLGVLGKLKQSMSAFRQLEEIARREGLQQTVGLLQALKLWTKRNSTKRIAQQC